jgi:hypothetical protein
MTWDFVLRSCANPINFNHKVKLYLCLLIKNYAMKAYGESGYTDPQFLDHDIICRCVVSASSTCRLTPVEIAPVPI